MIRAVLKDRTGLLRPPRYTVALGLHGDDAERLVDGGTALVDLAPVIALGVRNLRLAVAVGPTAHDVEQALERELGPLPFICPDCSATSYHPQDKRYGYCGRCRAYTGAPR